MKRRRTLKINNQLQNRYILESLLIAFVLVNAVTVCAFLAQEYLADKFDFKIVFASVLVFGELIGLVAAYVFLLRSSHKIAGPLYVFANALKRIENGDLACQVQLRKGDGLTDMAEVLNNTANGLREKMVRIASRVEQLGNEGRDQSPAQRKLIEELREELANFELGEKKA